MIFCSRWKPTRARLRCLPSFDGYFAAQLAESGEDVPVGDTIAIISAAPPDTPVVRRHATQTVDDNAPPVADDTNRKPSPPPKPEPERRSNAAQAGTPRSDGRILASPKRADWRANRGWIWSVWCRPDTRSPIMCAIWRC